MDSITLIFVRTSIPVSLSESSGFESLFQSALVLSWWLWQDDLINSGNGSWIELKFWPEWFQVRGGYCQIHGWLHRSIVICGFWQAMGTNFSRVCGLCRRRRYTNIIMAFFLQQPENPRNDNRVARSRNKPHKGRIAIRFMTRWRRFCIMKEYKRR